MSSHRDPLRLTDLGSHANPELAAAIRGLRERHGSVEQACALEQRVAAELKRLAVSGPKTRTGGGSGWLAGVVMFGAVGTSLLQPSALERQANAPPIAVAVTLSAAPQMPEPARVVPSAAAAPPVEKRRPRSPRALAAPLSERTSNDAQAPEGELSLLLRAHEQVRRNPQLALELTEQHVRDYPHGLFAQQREVIAIDALLQQHEPKARLSAHQRALQFVGAHDGSANAVRIRKLLDHWAGPVAVADPSLSPPNSVELPADP